MDAENTTESRPESTPAEAAKPAEAKPQPQPQPQSQAKPAEPARTEPAKPPEGVYISPEQLAQFRQAETTLKTLQAAEEARAEEARKAEEARMIEEGKLKEVIANKDKTLAERDAALRETATKFKATILQRELAVELGKHALVEGASLQLMKLLQGELETVADGDIFRVQTRDGKPVDRFVAETLKSKEYGHFVPPASRGGAGSQGADRRAPEPPPLDPNDRMAEQLRASYSARHEGVPVALAGRNRLAGGMNNN